MKKFLVTLCILITVFCLYSCDDNQTNPESSISEIEYVKYETDYLSFECPSDWEIEKDSSSGMMDNITIHSDGSLIFLNYSISDVLYKKLTTAELKDKWEKNAEDLKKEAEYDEDSEFLYKEKYENYEITDDFVKNGQAYILATNNVNNLKYIEFQTNGLSGTLNLYSDGAEEDAMTILETLEFN